VKRLELICLLLLIHLLVHHLEILCFVQQFFLESLYFQVKRITFEFPLLLISPLFRVDRAFKFAFCLSKFNLERSFHMHRLLIDGLYLVSEPISFKLLDSF